MSHAVLATQKQEKLSGGDVNYYLEVLEDGTVVEIEDVIERCQMEFSSGTTFKSIVRLCKLRKDLGKPGSTKPYEAGKGVYYSDRAVVITERRLSTVHGWKKVWRFVEYQLKKDQFKDPLKVLITIPDPKRLDAYSFYLGDFIKALNPTPNEAEVLLATIMAALLRKSFLFSTQDELVHAKRAYNYATLVNRREATISLDAIPPLKG
jgi:hypothetical protein